MSPLVSLMPVICPFHNKLSHKLWSICTFPSFIYFRAYLKPTAHVRFLGRPADRVLLLSAYHANEKFKRFCYGKLTECGKRNFLYSLIYRSFSYQIRRSSHCKRPPPVRSRAFRSFDKVLRQVPRHDWQPSFCSLRQSRSRHICLLEVFIIVTLSWFDKNTKFYSCIFGGEWFATVLKYLGEETITSTKPSSTGKVENPGNILVRYAATNGPQSGITPLLAGVLHLFSAVH